MTVTKQAYMTNKDMLREIHASKLTFCSILAPEYAKFDAIVTDLNQIDDELIAAVTAKCQAQKIKEKSKDIVNPEDLVFRLMTHEHIPLDPHRKRKARNTEQSHARTNFPPFKHFIRREGMFVEVLRSHWSGGFHNGHFTTETGTISNALAKMFIMLVERYGTRGNWRSYTYNDEMRSHALLHLSQIGLQFDESKSDNPFAFYTTSVKNCFTRILNVERRNQSIRDDMLIMAGASPSYTRQVENDMEYRKLDGTKRIPAIKRGPGRTPKAKV